MTDTSALFLVEVVGYDPNLGAVRTLRYSTAKFITEPGEAPPNTFYDPRVKQPLAMTRTMFGERTTRGRSTIGYGDIVLNNGDAALDDLINFGFDGRAVTVRRSALGAAYPGGLTTDLVGTMGGVEVTQEVVTLKLRDRQAEMNIPLQATKYTGAGLGTLEGVAGDLKGKPKPVCYGKVFNVAPPCVETAKLIYQVNDGAIASLDSVYDRGVALTQAFEWAGRSSGFGGTNIASVAYGAGLFVAVGDAGKLFTSPTGVTWTSRTSSFGASDIRHVRFFNSLFMATSSDGKVATSSDGITWTQRTTGLGATVLSRPVYGNGNWFLSDNTTLRATSSDGITWATAAIAPLGAIGTLVGTAFGNGYFLVVASNDYAYSTDGIAWTVGKIPNMGSSFANDVTYANGLFVIVGNSGFITTSDTGQSWTLRTFGSGHFQSVIAGPALFVAALAGSLVYSSTGLTWYQGPNAPTSNGQDLAYGDGIFVNVGNGATLDSTVISTYASTTDLLDNTLAPAPGHFKQYLAGGYFRLGATPSGLVTCDVTEGAAASDRTAAQLYKRLLLRSGKSASDYAAGDLTSLDALANYVCGFWTDQEAQYAAVFDQIAESPGASWFIDKSGVFRIKQFAAPSGSPVYVFTAHDLVKPLVRLVTNDPGQGLPSYQTIVRYQRNNTVQEVDVAASVTDARRAVIGKEWLEVKSTDASVQNGHPLAIQSVEDSLLTVEADAQAEATRRQGLRGVPRDLFQLVVPLNSDTSAIDLNDVIGVRHERYGLSVVGGEDPLLFRVIGIAPDGEKRTITFIGWGSASSPANWVDDVGDFMITDEGAYFVFET